VLAGQLQAARQRADRVQLPEHELHRITRACAQLGIDGARGDITCSVAAMALAALEGEDEVRREHVERAARYALAHRTRRDPLAKAGAQPDLRAALEGDQLDAPAPPRTRPEPVATTLPTAALAVAEPGSGPSGRRARSAGSAAGAIDSRAKGADDELALVPSLVATIASGQTEQRAAIRGGREGVLLCFVVDGSGSMASRRRAARVKGALLQMLRDAYARRDKVMVVVFRDYGAELLVEPGTPLEQAAAAVHDMETGGRTPLAAGLNVAAEHVAAAARRDRDRRAIAVLVTDGRATDRADEVHAAARALARAADAFHVVDTDEGPVRVGISAALAQATGGLLHVLEPIGGHA
jgi:magnesium chelatase subunit D